MLFLDALLGLYEGGKKSPWFYLYVDSLSHKTSLFSPYLLFLLRLYAVALLVQGLQCVQHRRNVS